KVEVSPTSDLAILGTHAYAREGTFTVTTVIADSGGVTTTRATATVVTLVATEGRPFNDVVVVISASSASPTATIAWGDGSASAGTVTARGGGLFEVSGSHTYAEVGTYPLTVTVNDGGTTLAVTGTAAVLDAPAAVEGLVLSASPGGAVSGTVARFFDSN